MRMIFVDFLVLLFFFSSDIRAQETLSMRLEDSPKVISTEIPPATRQVELAQVHKVEEKHPRLFWIMPTFSISNGKSSTSLSSAAKFHLFLRNTTDPFNVGYIAFTAGIQQANTNLSGYGQGAAGYGKRLSAGLADQASSGFFRTYLFPSVLHQDPRYFREGSGPFKNRLAHAIMRPVVTRKDSGVREFDWSGILGLTTSSSLANVYYPANDRGATRTFRRVATGISSSAIDCLIDEFGPDFEKRFLRRK